MVCQSSKSTRKHVDHVNLERKQDKLFQNNLKTKKKKTLDCSHRCLRSNAKYLTWWQPIFPIVRGRLYLLWVYFLKNKSKTVLMFKKFKAMVDTQWGCKIKILRSNGGEEFASSEFNKLFWTVESRGKSQCHICLNTMVMHNVKIDH